MKTSSIASAQSHRRAKAEGWRANTRLKVEALFWLLVLSAVCVSSNVFGQYGTLDTTWGGGLGYVKTAILSPTTSNATDSARAIAVQLDGKVVVAGVCAPSAYNACVARYNTNGTLDTSFNATGYATYPITGGDANFQATGIALTPYGQILIVYGCKDTSTPPIDQFCAIRFSVDGTVDTSFGTNGLLRTTLSTNGNYPSSVAYQSDGRIILSGRCGNRICALRFPEDGSALDTSFGASGIALTSATATGQTDRESIAMTLDFNDRVLLAGTCNPNTVFCVSRFTKDGAVDTSFGSNGIVAANVFNGAASYAYAIALQNGGEILLTGKTFNTIAGVNRFDHATVRYTVDGAVDTTFGTNGVVVTRVGDWDGTATSAVLSQADGKIVIAGYCQDFPARRDRFCLVGYNADGSLDTSFNGTGISKLPLVGDRDKAYAMTLGRDGKLLVAGDCRYTGSTKTYFCVARYNGSPTGGLPCNVNLDSSGAVLVISDSLLHARTINRLYNNPFAGFIMVSGLGVPFFVDAWTPIYKKLLRTSIDYDGDGAETATDSIIHARVASGFIGNAVTDGLTFAPNATRSTWATLRPYLVNRCGLNLP
jgi:uncharacterized delta-60 repeat protein